MQLYIRLEPTGFQERITKMSHQLPPLIGAMSVSDFAIWAGIGRTTAWKEIREGNLRAIKVSARTIIRFDDATRWLATRPQLQVRGFSSSTAITN
jgi:hypothetical protein